MRRRFHRPSIANDPEIRVEQLFLDGFERFNDGIDFHARRERLVAASDDEEHMRDQTAHGLL